MLIVAHVTADLFGSQGLRLVNAYGTEQSKKDVKAANASLVLLLEPQAKKNQGIARLCMGKLEYST